MAIPLMNDDVEIVQKLSDHPNQEDGLSSVQLKEKFDAASVLIKAYLNGTLVPAVQQLQKVLNNGEVIGVDDTLSIAGQAADAKATGAALAKLRCFGSLKDIGITEFPTTMAAVAAAMPNNSMIVIDTRTIMEGGTETIADWGITTNGTAYINKGYSIARVTMQILYGSSTAAGARLVVGNWASGEDGGAGTVNWLDYGLSNSKAYPGCVKRAVDGVDEWINPPMLDKVEYRTTMRQNGKPVYTMFLDIGAPGVTEYAVPGITIPASAKVFRVDGNTGGLPLSQSHHAEEYIQKVVINNGATYKTVTVHSTSADTAKRYIQVQLWYTK